MDLIKQLDEVRARTDVLTHPFYERWTAGSLAPEELSLYAGEYRHAVVALAEAAEHAAASAAREAPAVARELDAHAREEREHVALWDEFIAATDARMARSPGCGPPCSETSACVEAWTAGEDLLERLSILYAIEASQPSISATKLDGLERHYGSEPGDRGRAYFELHATRDIVHARQAGDMLERLASEDDAPRLLARAEAALAGNWTLLDGVEAGSPALAG
ncbi:MAG: iron-containing redox enzyme family protein [Solirubrobacteraceae bacterium]